MLKLLNPFLLPITGDEEMLQANQDMEMIVAL